MIRLTLISLFVFVVLAPVVTAEPVRVAVCQTLCIDSDKDGNLLRIENAIEKAAERGAQLAAFPECAVLGWVNPEAHQLADPIPGPTTDRLGKLAREHNMMISIGLCEKDGDKLYDSAVLIDSDGSILGVHRKVNTLGHLMDPPYTPGESVGVFETRLGRIGMLVCADTFKDDLVSQIRTQDADLLLVPYGWAAAKDAWPEHGQSLRAWVEATARRAGCDVVGTDLVGSISSGPWAGMVYGGQSVVVSGGDVIVLTDRDVEVRIVEVGD